MLRTLTFKSVAVYRLALEKAMFKIKISLSIKDDYSDIELDA